MNLKRCKKTYAIFHLAEKHTVFYLGKTKVHVSFTGGVVTKKGVTPATYTTDDPIIQLAIESSKDFLSGAIILRSRYELDGEVKIGRNEDYIKLDNSAKEDNITYDKPVVHTCEEEESASDLEDNFTCDKQAAHTEGDSSDFDGSGDTDGGKDASAPNLADTSAAELAVVEVSCKDVAKQYLQEHFGENPAPLRKIADVQECAAKYGLTFSFV